MEKTLLNIKIEKKLKQNAQKVAHELRLPLGTIINAYLRELVHEKRVVFSVPELPNIHTQNLLQQISFDIRNQENTVGPFSYEEAIEYLDAS